MIGLTAALLLATNGANAWNNVPRVKTTCDSVSSARAQANGNSGEDAISADGRYVAFTAAWSL